MDTKEKIKTKKHKNRRGQTKTVLRIQSSDQLQQKQKPQCGLSSVGRASALQAEGQDFDYPSLQTPSLIFTPSVISYSG